MATNLPGHLYGPPVPHIAFWYGDCLLGEARGHPTNVEPARNAVAHTIQLLEPGPDGMAKLSRLAWGARAVLYCGQVKRPLF